MELPKILTNQNASEKAILKQSCQPVTFPLNQEALETIEQLFAVMHAKGIGAGLAAPQIGVNLQIMLCSFTRKMEDLTVMINPSYTYTDNTTQDCWEGCFSVPLSFAKVPRLKSIQAKYHTAEGICIEQDLNDVAAKMFLHESDHLQGILMTDRAIELKTFTTEAEFNVFLAEIRANDAKASLKT